jgi:SPX domain protein involved in polyphosphate accumulation
MKFGAHLRENIAPEYGPDAYIAYDRLDDIIRELSSRTPAK